MKVSLEQAQLSLVDLVARAVQGEQITITHEQVEVQLIYHHQNSSCMNTALNDTDLTEMALDIDIEDILIRSDAAMSNNERVQFAVQKMCAQFPISEAQAQQAVTIWLEASGSIIDKAKCWHKIDVQNHTLANDATQWAAVLDDATLLMWAVNPDAECNYPIPTQLLTWDKATQCLEDVNRARWCGHSDWRLPTIIELKTLLTYSKQAHLLIREDVFSDINEANHYAVWSSPIVPNNSVFGYCLDFTTGNEFSCDKTSRANIRLVRSCEFDDSQFLEGKKTKAEITAYKASQNDRLMCWTKIGVRGEKVAIDAQRWAAVVNTNTQLMWAIDTIGMYGFGCPNGYDILTWDNALAYVKRINEEGWCDYNDWRLPTIDELITLFTPSSEHKLSKHIDERLFVDVANKINYAVWSSTIDLQNQVRSVNFSTGNTVSLVDKQYRRYLRLVRSHP